MNRSSASLCCALVLAGACSTARSADGDDGDFIYYARLHDTLIGISRRLLLQPRQWPAIQARNHIADPRRIPDGTGLRIPYAWLRTSPESAAVAGVGGTVSLSGRALIVGDRLSQGAVVETGADGSVTIDLADGSTVTLQKSSVLKLDQMVRIDGVEAAHSTQLKLDAGRVEAAVKPHRDVGRFEIITPVAVSAVRGTQFRDAYTAEDTHAATETLEGAVSVGAAAVAVPVPAGYGTRVEQGRAPLPPVVLLPSPDLSLLTPLLSAPEIRLAWPAVAGAAGYRVQLAAGPDFHVLTLDQQVSAPDVMLPLLADGSWWLRVRTIDALGLEGQDGVLPLIRHRLPDTPQPDAPADGARVSAATVPFAWSAATAAAHYRVQVAGDAGFEAPLVELPVAAGLTVNSGELAPGHYRWRVAGVSDTGENGPWSEPRSVVRQPAAPLPDAPVIVAKTLQLHWPAVPGQRYRVQVARDAGFRRTFLDQQVERNELALPRPFPYDYFVRIQLIDRDGSAGEYGPIRPFQVPVPWWAEILAHTVLLLPLVL